jgi:hypothetical protein
MLVSGKLRYFANISARPCVTVVIANVGAWMEEVASETALASTRESRFTPPLR